MRPEKQIGAKVIIVDGKECTVRVFEASVPKPKTNEVRPTRKCQPGNEDDWNVEDRMASDSPDVPSKTFARRSRSEERHREEDER